MIKMSKNFAENVSKKSVADAVRSAFEMAVSRIPTNAELELLNSYAKKHGLAATCRIIFNLNEFSFID